MVARAAKVETSPDLLAVFATPVSSDPDAVAYWYHKNSWGKYYGSSFYTNPDVWGLIERAHAGQVGPSGRRSTPRSRSGSWRTCPRCSACWPTGAWGMRDYVKGFVFSPVRLTGEVDLYPLAIVTK